MKPVKLWKAGLLTFGSGILAVIVSYIPGAGPCGPSTPIGFVVMLLGFFAIPVGIVILIIGWIRAF